MDPLTLHRLHFAFTITYHYFFPQLTMGLAFLIFVLKTLALRTRDAVYDSRGRFWSKIFGVKFVVGVVTGIPMKSNSAPIGLASRTLTGASSLTRSRWKACSRSFSSRRFSSRSWSANTARPHSPLVAALLVWIGTWLSGFFVVVADAWMQHPVGYRRRSRSFADHRAGAVLSNPWRVRNTRTR